MTSPLKQQQIMNSLHTGFIDKDNIWLEKYRPKLLLNNHKQGQKVFSSYGLVILMGILGVLMLGGGAYNAI